MGAAVTVEQCELTAAARAAFASTPHPGDPCAWLADVEAGAARLYRLRVGSRTALWFVATVDGGAFRVRDSAQGAAIPGVSGTYEALAAMPRLAREAGCGRYSLLCARPGSVRCALRAGMMPRGVEMEGRADVL